MFKFVKVSLFLFFFYANFHSFLTDDDINFVAHLGIKENYLGKGLIFDDIIKLKIEFSISATNFPQPTLIDCTRYEGYIPTPVKNDNANRAATSAKPVTVTKKPTVTSTTTPKPSTTTAKPVTTTVTPTSANSTTQKTTTVKPKRRRDVNSMLDLDNKEITYCNYNLTQDNTKLKIESEPDYILINEVLHRIVFTEGTRTAKFLVCLPKSLRLRVIEICHDTLLEGGHQGKHRTIDKIKSRFYWPTLASDVAHHVTTCKTCQAYRERSDKPEGRLHSIPVTEVFYRVGMDLIGPLPVSNRNNKYILVIIDYATRYGIAAPIPDKRAETVAIALIENLFLKFGVPGEIQSDRGTEFHGAVSDAIKNLQSTQFFTTSYHPQANGLVERYNKTLISHIRKFLTNGVPSRQIISRYKDTWETYFPYVVWHYNTTKQQSLNQVPFILVFGREPIFPIDHFIEGYRKCNSEYLKDIGENIEYLRELARSNLREKQMQQTARYNAKRKLATINVGDWVLLKNLQNVQGVPNKFLSRYIPTPFLVLAKKDDDYLIKMSDTHKQRWHISNLKKYNIRKNAYEKEKENDPIMYGSMITSNLNDENNHDDDVNDTNNDNSRETDPSAESQDSRGENSGQRNLKDYTESLNSDEFHSFEGSYEKKHRAKPEAKKNQVKTSPKPSTSYIPSQTAKTLDWDDLVVYPYAEDETYDWHEFSREKKRKSKKQRKDEESYIPPKHVKFDLTGEKRQLRPRNLESTPHKPMAQHKVDDFDESNRLTTSGYSNNTQTPRKHKFNKFDNSKRHDASRDISNANTGNLTVEEINKSILEGLKKEQLVKPDTVQEFVDRYNNVLTKNNLDIEKIPIANRPISPEDLEDIVQRQPQAIVTTQDRDTSNDSPTYASKVKQGNTPSKQQGERLQPILKTPRSATPWFGTPEKDQFATSTPSTNQNKNRPATSAPTNTPILAPTDNQASSSQNTPSPTISPSNSGPRRSRRNRNQPQTYNETQVARKNMNYKDYKKPK